MLLVRHASAGKREAWSGDDRVRPLDERGRRQAEFLVRSLADYPVERIVTSPYLRCVQTVDPLAQARGLDVELRAELGDAVPAEDAVAVLRELAGADAVVCVHGSIEDPLRLDRFPKGATYVLGSQLEPLEYVPPAA